MKLNNKLYDVLKWCVLIVLPAIGTFYSVLAGIWNLPLPDEINQTILALCTLVGAVIGLSTAEYRAHINTTEDENK